MKTGFSEEPKSSCLEAAGVKGCLWTWPGPLWGKPHAAWGRALGSSCGEEAWGWSAGHSSAHTVHTAAAQNTQPPLKAACFSRFEKLKISSTSRSLHIPAGEKEGQHTPEHPLSQGHVSGKSPQAWKRLNQLRRSPPGRGHTHSLVSRSGGPCFCACRTPLPTLLPGASSAAPPAPPKSGLGRPP